MSWVYWRSEPGLWTVGNDGPGGKHAESDHSDPENAAERVHWLNGGGPGDSPERIDTLEATYLTVLARLAALETAVFGKTDFPISPEAVAAAIAADLPAAPPRPGEQEGAAR